MLVFASPNLEVSQDEKELNRGYLLKKNKANEQATAAWGKILLLEKTEDMLKVCAENLRKELFCE